MSRLLPLVGIAALLILVFVLWPSRSNRERTLVVVSNTQARRIHQAQIMYTQDQHGGSYSNDIAELFEKNHFTADYAVSPFVDTKLPKDFDTWPQDQQNQWVRQNASFILVPGLTEILDSEIIAVFLRPDHSNGDGISVAYDDNHVVWETDIDAIDRKLQAQTGMTIQQLIDRQVNYDPNQTPADAPKTPAAPR